MTQWTLIFRNLAHRKFLSLLTVISVTVTVALLVFLILCQASVDEGAKKGYGPFELVIGADGSDSQLVLNTFYHVGAPTGNIPLDVLNQAKENDQVMNAYGMTTGDNYNGFPIVGLEAEYFFTRYGDQKLASGKLYQSLGDVVVGAHVAKSLNLHVGDTFKGGHGVIEEADHSFEEEEGGHHDAHETFAYRITGILPFLNTPDDRAVFTTMEYAWAVHGEEQAHKEVTAILIKPKSIGGLPLIKQQYEAIDNVQAAYTSKAVADVLSVVDKGTEMISLVTVLCMILASISILLSLTAAANERQKDVGLLRIIGKSKRFIFMSFIGEGLVLVSLGLLIGLAAGHLSGFLFKDILFEYTGIQIKALLFNGQHVLLIVGTILFGLLAMLIPSFKMYRIDPMQLFRA
ncbi:ABC transporter permease [Paenibacillus sp. FJAT-27812]|uniref:ABC transporter permease n=1 Tax=Paenibacillus sp. FJAT-27812 TaxID=1684143 RepID=UPI0006A7D631|nr:FtsX-like permease family protein [Paenibacillus sp. FJAT-27812]